MRDPVIMHPAEIELECKAITDPAEIEINTKTPNIAQKTPHIELPILDLPA